MLSSDDAGMEDAARIAELEEIVESFRAERASILNGRDVYIVVREHFGEDAEVFGAYASWIDAIAATPFPDAWGSEYCHRGDDEWVLYRDRMDGPPEYWTEWRIGRLVIGAVPTPKTRGSGHFDST